MLLLSTGNPTTPFAPAYRRCHPAERPFQFLSLALPLVFYAGLVWREWAELLAMLRDPATLQTFLSQIGWWGPAVLIALNIVQIVIAPIPGYAVYLAAGYLYGVWWGGLWGSLGMLAGGMVAMFVARCLGRPLVARLMGVEALARWEMMTHSKSLWVWGAILVSPIGDAPFLLAGLASIEYGKILLLTILTRVPAAFAAAAIGAGAMQLAGWQITLLALTLTAPLLLLNRGQTALMATLEHWIKRWLPK